MAGFTGAVTSASLICLGLNHLFFTRLSFDKSSAIGRFLPFPAVASANIVNLLCMRRHELEQGIQVVSPDGQVVGVSKVAAWHAVRDTSITRVILPMPNLIIAPILITALERTKFIRKNPRIFIPAQAAIVSLVFLFGLPFSLSLFEQMGEISVQELEENTKKAALAMQLDTVRYNKGL